MARSKAPSPRMVELLNRLVSVSGPVASALSASEWHELQEEAAGFLLTLPSPRRKVEAARG